MTCLYPNEPAAYFVALIQGNKDRLRECNSCAILEVS
jgi:hypothetical protein